MLLFELKAGLQTVVKVPTLSWDFERRGGPSFKVTCAHEKRHRSHVVQTALACQTLLLETLCTCILKRVGGFASSSHCSNGKEGGGGQLAQCESDAA